MPLKKLKASGVPDSMIVAYGSGQLKKGEGFLSVRGAPANPVEDLRTALKTGLDPLGGLA